MIGTKSYSDAMHQYAELLLELHRMVRACNGDSDEADELRDRMDGPWREMTNHEISITDGLSVDLYSIGKDRTANNAIAAPNAAIAFEHAYRNKEYPRLLEIVRSEENRFPRAHVAGFRGWLWLQMGFSNVAFEFLEEMKALEQTLPVTDLLIFEAAERSQRFGYVFEHIKSFNTETDPLLWMYASGFFARYAAVDHMHYQKWYQEAFMAGSIGLKSFASLPAKYEPAMVKPILSSTNLVLAVACMVNGDQLNAKKFAEEALRIDPDNIQATIINNSLIADHTSDKIESRAFINRLTGKSDLLDFTGYSAYSPLMEQSSFSLSLN